MYLFKVFCFLFLISTINCDQSTDKEITTPEPEESDLSEILEHIDSEVATGETTTTVPTKVEEETETNAPAPEPEKEKEPEKPKPDEPKEPEEKPSEKSGENKTTEIKPIDVKTQPKSGLRRGSVWGIAIGIIGMIATTVLLIVFILKRRRGDDRLIR